MLIASIHAMDQNQYRAIDGDLNLGGGVLSRATRHRDAVKIFPRDAGSGAGGGDG